MSLVPFFHFDPWELRRYYSPHRLQHSPWDHFGLDITPGEFQYLSAIPLMLARGGGNHGLQAKGSEGGELLPKPVVGKSGFEVHMDVQQFKPSEVTVKTVGDFIVIEGKHDEREDEHGFISRNFVRKYKLPKGYDANQVSSTLSSDSVLTVKVPLPTKTIEGGERVVQIQQVGPAHLNVKVNKTEKGSQNGDK